MAAPSAALAEAHVCGACKEVLCNGDGIPRLLTHQAAHICSHCAASLHSAMISKLVWMPTLKNNGRTFCTEEHVHCWNKACSESEKVPLQ
eukprot:2469722-Pleurochrysis_carterae.AAC.1